MKLLLKTAILSGSQVIENISNFNRQKFRIEKSLPESNFDLHITDVVSNELHLKLKIEETLEKINLGKMGFASLMIEKLKISLNDSLKTILFNYEDIRTLEANSIILKKNSHQFFKNALKENLDIRRNMANLLLFSATMAVTLFLLIK